MAATVMPMPQTPEPPPQDLIAQLQALGWVDHTALAVLLVFFVLGLFKGLIWQVSRVGILVVAYFVSGRYGQDVAGWFGREAPAEGAAEGAVADAAATGETTLYLAYVLLFLAVLVVLSLVAMLVKKLADKAGLGFFDRLGGGVLGIATGACVVLALVFVVNMFFPGTRLAQAAESSHSLRLSRQAIDWLGSAVDDDLRAVLALRRLERDGTARPEAPAGGPSSAQPVDASAAGTGTPGEKPGEKDRDRENR